MAKKNFECLIWSHCSLTGQQTHWAPAQIWTQARGTGDQNAARTSEESEGGAWESTEGKKWIDLHQATESSFPAELVLLMCVCVCRKRKPDKRPEGHMEDSQVSSIKLFMYIINLFYSELRTTKIMIYSKMKRDYCWYNRLRWSRIQHIGLWCWHLFWSFRRCWFPRWSSSVWNAWT